MDTSGRGFDIADEGFDFPNPDPSMIEFPLTAEAGMRTTPAMRREDHAASPLRDAAWGRLELALARGPSPLVAYAIRDTITLSSVRTDCLVYQPEYGIDLIQLCLAPRRR